MADIVATYRLQFHAGFPLSSAREIVPYLSRLGVSHIHASPLLQARTGSTHGYDVVDPTRLDRARGTEEDLAALVETLRRHGMGLVLDIVPNHMAASDESPAWEDVLTHGQASDHARWFDIDWRSADRDAWNRLLLPVLGDARASAIARDEITLGLGERGLRVRYHQHTFPIDPSTAAPVLAAAQAELRRVLGPDHPTVVELDGIVAILRHLPRRSSRRPAALCRRRVEAAAAVARLRAVREWPGGEILGRKVAGFGEGVEGRRRLRRLLDAQVYRLVHWRRAAREINYRRFFDVNDLVSLHMEDPEVFAQTHATVLEWRGRGWIDGFRIDHPDGLLDPLAYLQCLAGAAFGGPTGRPPLWAEKILSHGEQLRPEWPVAGTTGYDFLNQVERLFVDPRGLDAVQTIYRHVLRRPVGFEATAAAGKRLALETSLSAGVRALARRLQRLDSRPAGGIRPSMHAIMRAVIEVIVALPVYRTYVDSRDGPPDPEDRRLLAEAVEVARGRGRAEPEALARLAVALVGGDETPTAEMEAARRRFIQRFQQLSGPATAKGIEDTAFYRHAALFSLNEVGGAPEVPVEDAPAAFHRSAALRADEWPGAMLTLTTHDTKRTSDVRARLDVLTEIPDEWKRWVGRWRRLNLRHKRTVRGRRAPDPNSVYQLFQAIVGIWPESDPSPDEVMAVRDRVKAYAIKAAREAKDHTSWVDPDEEFEAALTASIDSLLSPGPDRTFLDELGAFVARIAPAGWWNAIARTLIQLTAPGTPDLYQGDELWTLALVDPDNRRPVDFASRVDLLDDLARGYDAGGAGRRELLDRLVVQPGDGRLKLHVVRRALHARRHRGELREGAYVPLEAEGAGAATVVAFGRVLNGDVSLVAVPRLIGRSVIAGGRRPTDPALWGGIWLRPPADWPRHWTCALSGETVQVRDGRIAATDLFARLPAALLTGEPSA